jgi:hypothetical protein
MKKTILFLITITTLTNVSYASFPVVEKVSNQTTETVINCNQRGTFDPDLILWTIIVFPLLVLFGFLLKMKRRTGGRGQMLLKILAWTLYLLSIPLVIIWMFIGFLSLFGIPLDL